MFVSTNGCTKSLLLGVALGCLFLLSCVATPPPEDTLALTVSVEQQASWTRNFNPLTGNARWPTAAGIYEPLLIFNRSTQSFQPWLAVKYAWSEQNRTLGFSTRKDVKWSDGVPFSAKDVAFTFTYLRDNPGLDKGGLWKHLESVQSNGANEVEFHFKKTFVPGLEFIASQPIIAEHIWRSIPDPLTYANAVPVGTGPFTEVLRFQDQIYELGRNENYWQKGLPRVERIRCPAFPGNDSANLALISGEVDWAGNFVPAIDRIFVDKDPEHHHYWFPLTGTMVFLYTNTTREPLDQVEVRKALSLSVNRELMVRVAMYQYTEPADSTGLGDAYAEWKTKAGLKKADWIAFNPTKAESLLDSAGFPRNKGGIRVDKNGEPFSLEILVVNQWSDWVRAAQVVQKSLSSIGIEASVRTYDFSAWFERVQKGEFDLAIGWSTEGVSPYGYFRWLLDPDTVEPVGELASGNWHRYGSPGSEELFAALASTSSPEEEAALVTALQKRFVDEAPSIPLFPNPAWGAYNSKRFGGFPNAENPYAPLAPYDPASLVVLTRLFPRGVLP